MDCYLADYIETEIKKVSNEKVDELLSMIPQLWCFTTIWSVGTTTNLSGREKFNAYMREKMKKIGVEFPEEKLVYDYQFDVVGKKWRNWFETIKEYQVDITWSFNEIVVPTLDSIRMKYLIKLLITNGKHVLTPGPTGTGKSVNTSELLVYEFPEEF